MQTLSPQQARAVAARVQAHLDAGALEDAVTLAEVQMANAIGEARAILQHALALACNLVGRSVEALRAAAAAREGFKAIDSREGELDALLAIGSVDALRGRSRVRHDRLRRGQADGARVALRHSAGRGAAPDRRELFAFGSTSAGVVEPARGVIDHSREPTDREHLSTLLSLYNAPNRRAATGRDTDQWELPAERPRGALRL